jgi:glycosyltransferase involved in cell wall biosynthesis
MKVLIFTSQFMYGAAERLGAELAVSLNQTGIHADLMSLYSENYENSAEAAQSLCQRGVPEIKYLNLAPNPSFIAVLRAIWRLVSIIRFAGYSAVETSSATPSIIASWACLVTGTVHVAGVHRVFELARPESLRDCLYRWSLRCIGRNYFYAVSDFVKRNWCEYSGSAPERVRVIYNAISQFSRANREDALALRRSLGVRDGSRVGLCVARLAAYKRQEFAVLALAPLFESENLVLLLVGREDLTIPGTREMLDRIHQFVAENGLEQRVLFLGQRDDVNALLSLADFLIHPTEEEAFGLVLAEAMAASVPVISTRVDGIPEVVQGTESILVEPCTPSTLREAVQLVLNRSIEERSRCAELGEFQARRFSHANRAVCFVSFLKEIQVH